MLECQRVEREKEVFGVAKGGKLKNHTTVDVKGNRYTVPEPFHLTKAKKDHTRSLEQQVEKQMLKECTFMPDTLEMQRAELIKQILNENNDFDNLNQGQNQTKTYHKYNGLDNDICNDNTNKNNNEYDSPYDNTNKNNEYDSPIV
eukprot:CAMPEP_0116901636 /NCGR_PEP_ID=MMETSP0467-20121206/9490_1 /TAXON_ID=283647 /ORGANISM="Mesodinium pulex, Strain SPMC105" /LENGTH=144 /DNA_ID=CAMNT_0004575225 /DNA_START=1814 /DNA_END=2248 /DNA_ORIENTATION=-